MTEAVTPVVIAILSAAISLTTAIGLEYSRRRSSREIELLRTDQQRSLEHFKDELLRSRELESKSQEALRLVGRYRDPLLQSAFDLQARLYNVIGAGQFREPRDREYFQESTLFVVGQFFGWLEIIRRDMQFLDLGGTEATMQLSAKLGHIRECFAVRSTWEDDYYILRSHQRAIGELMISRVEPRSATGPHYECIGYVAFVSMYKEQANSRWFDRLGQAIARIPGHRPERLVAVQHALIDLVDQLDPESVRFTGSRDRL